MMIWSPLHNSRCKGWTGSNIARDVWYFLAGISLFSFYFEKIFFSFLETSPLIFGISALQRQLYNAFERIGGAAPRSSDPISLFDASGIYTTRLNEPS